MCATDMNNERDSDKVTKESFKDYIYVMVSTLNQMVNYIPLKHFTFKEVVNITINDSLYADNAKWDKNLSEVLGSEVSISSITFKQSEITNPTELKKRLNELRKGKEKIFWNITGGQRPFVLAINQFIQDRQDDVICYLEGNKSQMVLLQNGNEIKGMPSYDLEGMNIETALKLMGFDLRSIEKKEGKDTERQFYLDFYSKYTDEKNVSLRKALIKLNETKKPDCDSITDSLLTEIKFCDHTKEDFKKQYPLGYILEKLAFYQFEKIVSTNKALVVHSLKIIFDDEDLKKETGNKTIDEFDIALLTKNGKFMIFECKSGGMDGDVAKSTKYSTYAVSGAYGLPILITPLLASEINDIDNLDKAIYSSIQSAVKSANRAGLKVWGLDKIEENLKKYIG